MLLETLPRIRQQEVRKAQVESIYSRLAGEGIPVKTVTVIENFYGLEVIVDLLNFVGQKRNPLRSNLSLSLLNLESDRNRYEAGRNLASRMIEDLKRQWKEES